jgi:hypothetical protein
VKKPATLIHVNQHVLRANLKARDDQPMLTCKQAKLNTYAHEAMILGPSRFVNGMHKPLSCGARIWIRTDAQVEFRTFGAELGLRLPSPSATIIRVNSKAIRENVKNGTDEPVLSFVRNGIIITAREVVIHGSAVVRTANLALEHEGRIWVETEAEVECVERPLPVEAGEYESCAVQA